MREIWLRANRRALVLGMILPIVLAILGLFLVLGVAKDGSVLVRGLGWLLVGGGILLWGVIALQLKIPRLAYEDGRLLVYLAAGGPIGVPVEYAECFFLASGSGQLLGTEGSEVKIRNLVMRVAEKAQDFQRREVKPALGRWDDGYVTIYGAWCEPLTLEIVQRLNARLAAVQQATRDPAGEKK